MTTQRAMPCCGCSTCWATTRRSAVTGHACSTAALTAQSADGVEVQHLQPRLTDHPAHVAAGQTCTPQTRSGSAPRRYAGAVEGEDTADQRA